MLNTIHDKVPLDIESSNPTNNQLENGYSRWTVDCFVSFLTTINNGLETFYTAANSSIRWINKNAPVCAVVICSLLLLGGITATLVILLSKECTDVTICNELDDPKGWLYYDSDRILPPKRCFTAQLPKENQPTKEVGVSFETLLTSCDFIEKRRPVDPDSEKDEVVKKGCNDLELNPNGWCGFKYEWKGFFGSNVNPAETVTDIDSLNNEKKSSLRMTQ